MNALGRLRRSPAFAAGATLLALILLSALLAPVLAPYPPNAQNLTGGLLPPSPEHWFGTDQLGRDVLSRMLFAAQTDLRVSVLAALAPFVIGVTVGLVTGYFGGAVDWVGSRIIDTVIAFPFYVIVIAIVFAVGAGEGGIIVAFALVGWVGYARVLRAMTAALRESGWVQAARGGGLSHARVLLRHLLPNVLPQAIVLLATEIVLIMVAIVTLGYLGLGIQPPTPDWGTMISDGQAFITTHWWLSALPGLAVVLTGVSLSLIGDGVGDALRVGAGARPRAGRAGRVDRGRGHASGRLPRANGPFAPPRRRIERPAGADAKAGAAGGASAALRAGEVRVRGLRVEAAPRGGGSGPVLVDGLSFEVRPGEAVGIVGESGSGKTLTLRALLGMMPPGTRVAAGEASAGGPVRMVFQDPLTALDPLTRVGVQLREAVEAAHDGSRAEAARRVRELLERVRLPDPGRIARAYPHQLSGGQRQRVVIAMALAGDPALLLCDEPTTALDVTVQRRVLELLDELRRSRGITLVFVSHDLAVVSSMCERVIVMRGGRAVESGETERVVRDPREPYTRALLDAVPALPQLAADPGPGTPLPGGRDAPQRPQGRTGARTPEALVAGGAASASQPPVLEVRGAQIGYGRALAVDGVSLAVRAGGALGIVGESGSGKTTLARAIVGQLPLIGGEILLDGRIQPSRRDRAARRAVQLVPQDPYSSLDPRMTVGQTLGELLRAHRLATGAESRARIAGLLESVRLDPGLARCYPHELSGGQRQRVAIARALAVEPRAIVADEPTSALDVSVQASVVELLRELRSATGVALVLVSHDLAVVHELCEEVLVMRGGEAVETGGAAFFTEPRTDYGRQLLSAVPRLGRRA
ncbi:ATP-binding cassette domain-containing protein [Leucobacter chironomi]|uniref:ABC transporter ATP-binding protein/permease n=1 Tax=Leucobacter chironomi TaxID=491918 RepID=UPI00040DCB98|nr:ATP-binding cassette domain-containing protein [Leucobacter chironomi]